MIVSTSPVCSNISMYLRTILSDMQSCSNISMYLRTILSDMQSCCEISVALRWWAVWNHTTLQRRSSEHGVGILTVTHCIQSSVLALYVEFVNPGYTDRSQLNPLGSIIELNVQEDFTMTPTLCFSISWFWAGYLHTHASGVIESFLMSSPFKLLQWGFSLELAPHVPTQACLERWDGSLSKPK